MNSKIIILIIILIGLMYYWITYPREGIEKIIFMLVIISLAYWIGRIQGKIIGECNKNAIQ